MTTKDERPALPEKADRPEMTSYSSSMVDASAGNRRPPRWSRVRVEKETTYDAEFARCADCGRRWVNRNAFAVASVHARAFGHVVHARTTVHTVFRPGT